MIPFSYIFTSDPVYLFCYINDSVKAEAGNVYLYCYHHTFLPEPLLAKRRNLRYNCGGGFVLSAIQPLIRWLMAGYKELPRRLLAYFNAFIKLFVP